MENSKKMKASDLHVGDFIMMPFYGKQVPGRVVQVNATHVWALPFVSNGHAPRTQFLPEDAVTPITLTGQLLACWGFKFASDDDAGYFGQLLVGENLPLTWFDDSKYIAFDTTTIPAQIRYAHQMQQVLRIFGIEVDPIFL